jgi:PKD repeat protein
MKKIFLIFCIAALMCMTGLVSAAVATDAPVTSFTVNTTSGTAPLTVQFTDISANATSWAWDFNNDGTVDSTEQNPVYTYSKAGNYSINLTVTNEGSSDSEVKTDYITVEGTGTGELADSPWPKYQRDNSNTGQSPYTGPQTNNTVWTYTTGGSLYSAPVIGSDGTIYIGNYDDKKVYALNANGTLKWTYTTGGYIIYGSPAIGSDGTIYIGNYGDKKIYALNADGTLKWTYATGGSIRGSPAIGSDGTIYIGNYGDKKLYALNADGTLKWTYNTGGSLWSSPAIGSDGTIYIGNYGDKKVYALNADGTLKWTYTTEGKIRSSPSIGSDGTIYIGNYGDKKVYALNADGTLKWTYTTGGMILSSPAIGSDGIYIGNLEEKKVYALNTDGTLKWTYKTEGMVYATSIGSDGTIYVGNWDGYKVYALNTDGTLKWTYTTGGEIYESPVIGSDGTLYVGSVDKKLYAFHDVTAPVASFTAFPISGEASLTVQFTDTSANYPTSWAWDFDNDGTVDSTEQNPSYTYVTPGTYTVNLTATNSAGSDSEILTDYITVITPVVPVAGFSANVTSGDVPLAVAFTDESTGNATSWAWDFDNDGTVDSTEQNPSYTYVTPGTYTVNLTATNWAGSDDEIKTDYIKVFMPPVPEADFNTNVTSGGAPLTVSFTDVSTNSPTSWAWDFDNDGKIDAVAQNPTYTYELAGIYTVNLTVSNAAGSDSEVKPDLITVTGEADLTATASFATTYPLTNNTVTVTVTNSGAVNAAAFNVTLLAGKTNTTVNMPGLGAGNDTTVSIIDIRRHAGDEIPITITVDPENAIAETNETNNVYTTNATITASGDRWQGGRFSTGHDLVNNVVCQEGNVGVATALSGTYTSSYGVPGVTLTRTFSAESMKIPAGATIKSARIYQGWSWYGDPGFKMQFNGRESQKPDVKYSDAINGQDVFDVTPYFNATDNNTAVLTSTSTSQNDFSCYGTLLVVVYEAASEPYRQIWVNEGSDCLLYSMGTGYTMFENVSTADLVSAKITTVLESGNDNDQNFILFNQGTVAKIGGTGVNSDPAFRYYDVTDALQNGTNELGVMCENYINFANAILEVTKETASEANFTANVTSGDAPLAVKFTDTSTGTPTNWTWDFGDGSTSTEQNPTHIYKSEGNYTVKLTVSNSLGSDSEEKTGYIIVGSAVLAPETNFGSNLTSGNAPLSVQFKDESTNSPTGWEWDFGDSKTSTEQNPSHIYETVGTYTVNLTAMNYGGSNSTTKTDYITVTSDTSAPVASFGPDANSGQVPFTVKFTDTSTGKVSSWNWDFGDGSTSTDQNPIHTYVAAGSYTVSLTATGPGGSNTATSAKPITVSASLTSPNYNGGIPLTTAQNGTVSGGLWCDSYPGFSTSAQKTFTLPDYTKIKWARLYVTVYDGHMENNYRGNVNIEIDGNGDSKYELQKTEKFDTTYSFPGTGGIGPVWLSDHMNRVTSDYLMWYDLTDLIKGNQVNVQATTTKVDSSFDGRVKAMTLVVAYDDGDSDQVCYWVNQGHDTVNPLDDTYTGSTAFGTSTLEKDWSSANLTAIFLASVDGTYSFQGTKLASGAKSGSYYGSNTWDISSLLTAGQDSKLDYNKQESNYYKVPLALMSVKYTSASPKLPTADFKADVTNGTVPLSVNFTDQSTGSISSYSWDFDNDGTVDSTEQNPIHIYNAAGNYTVNLTVSNADGSDSEVKTDYIVVSESLPGAPVADFAATPTSGTAPLTVNFTDQSTGNISSYSWDFDNDGTVDSTEQNPVHIYNAAGNYTVNLTVSNADGSDSEVKTDYIVVSEPLPEAPVANFTAIPTSGTAPFTVNFTDQSTGAVSSYAWDFNNDGNVDSSEQNPSYTYSTAGTYTVNLTVIGPGGSDSEVKTGYIKVTGSSPGKPVATFSASPASGKTPLTVAFTDKSSNMPTKWKWSFGDGASSTIQNPKHKYSAAGKYTVTLTVTNAKGSNTVTETDYIKVIAKPVANFTSSITSGKAPLNVVFTDTSTGTPSGWSWDFGDGSKSFVQNPTHKYSKAGTYTVSLTVKNAAGSNTVTKTENIKVTAKPAANFTSSATSGKAPLNVKFTDTSTGTPATWKWDFGDGTSSTQQNPTHRYSTAGTYTVILTVKNAVGSNTVTKTDYIKVTAKPVAEFSATPTSGKPSLTVAFTDTSTGLPTKWKWNFGDGTSSTIQNPKHKYSKAGSYTVTLTATNAAGSSTTTKTDYVKITA